ncbi:hypothetical protein [Micromonospora inositola]|uniref:Uncharacterized protein n=1 Tax=Micromonospora inositola TaxID=47865 RepID=A0A1C5J8W0_9ACTN|nr:hypothetical protein [Micromonospora inositola]SCG66997.1 hypothetical protein GA0070613_4236 [Micromonospora inositola]
MSVPTPDHDHQPEPGGRPPAGKAPGPVLAAAILLYVGGGLTLLYGLVGNRVSGGFSGLLPPWALVLYGLLYVGLGWGVQHGRRWARRTVLVLCGVGVALAAVKLAAGGKASAVVDLLWPLVYVALLCTEAARDWFGRTP